MDGASVEGSQLRRFLASRLEPLRASLRGRPVPAPRLARQAEALFLFPCELGDPRNLYGAAGLPRTHSAWEMQLIADDGALFFIYAKALAAVRESGDFAALEAAIEGLCAGLCVGEPAALHVATRRFYAAEIADFVTRESARRRTRGGWDARHWLDFEVAVIEAYVRVAMSAPGGVLTLDLFPANTGPDNVSEGLKGLVSANGARHGARGARRFWSIRAESYTRYYGINLARELSQELRFSLVVPYANGVRHIAMTRCWPIDGAENIARYVSLAQARRRELERGSGRGSEGEQGAEQGGRPTILVSGYSQGGAAVRLFNDALSGQDVRARAYFRGSAPRGHARDCRALTAILAKTEDWPVVVHTVSVATMGGIDGVGFGERYPQLRALARDQRGAAGVVGRSNAHGGVHLGICHDYDPARWILPGPLLKAHRRVRRRDRRKLNLVRILLKFGGPAKILHGGVWMAGTTEAFASNPAARALLDGVRAKLISERFVDEAGYRDERCSRAAFPHLVVGTLGYPGWAVVTQFTALLGARDEAGVARGAPPTQLLRERSWCCDILPREQAYEAVIAKAAAFEERQRELARRALDELVAASGGDGRLLELLRERSVPLPLRRHLLSEAGQ